MAPAGQPLASVRSASGYGGALLLGAVGAASIGVSNSLVVGGVLALGVIGLVHPSASRWRLAGVASVPVVGAWVLTFDGAQAVVGLWRVAGFYVVAVGAVTAAQRAAQHTQVGDARLRRLAVIVGLAALVIQGTALSYLWMQQKVDQRAQSYEDGARDALADADVPELLIDLNEHLETAGLDPVVVRGSGSDFSFTSEVKFLLAVRCVVVRVEPPASPATEVYKGDCARPGVWP